MSIDLERAIADTPGTRSVLHFNNAGASLPPRQVLDAMIGHLELEARIGGYEAANQESERIAEIYSSIARLINCGADEIALVEHATRGWDMAFYSVPFQPGDRILTAVAEYAANFVAFLQVAKRTGVVVEVVPNDEHGQLSVDALERMMDERVKLVAMTHVATNSGLVNPAAEVGRVTRQAGVLYLLDACQSVGQLPVDVERIGCDMLSATGRKFLRGPRGTGFLYVRRAVLDRLEPPMIDHHAAEWVARDRYELRADARRFENWEASYAARLGLGAAVDYLSQWGIDAVHARSAALADDLRSRLASIPKITLRDIGLHRSAIVTFSVDGVDPNVVKAALYERGINVSVSDVYAARLDMEARNLTSVVRASPHYYNTEREVERFASTLEALVQEPFSTTGV